MSATTTSEPQVVYVERKRDSNGFAIGARVTLRKVLVFITAATAGALALAPAAASAHISTCQSVYPQAEFPIQYQGTSCKVARDVDRYGTGHDTTDPANPFFRLDGHTWTTRIYSRWHNHTYFSVTTRGITVWLTSRLPVS